MDRSGRQMERQAEQAARMNSLREFVEQITVLDAETIRIKFRYPGLEIDKSLN